MPATTPNVRAPRLAATRDMAATKSFFSQLFVLAGFSINYTTLSLSSYSMMNENVKTPQKKSCHSIVIRLYDLRLTIFLFVIGGVIPTYDNAMTFLAIKV